MAQLKSVLLFALYLLVPLSSSTSVDVDNCDKNLEYVVRVTKVDISPYPVSRGTKTTFTIFASTDKELSGGRINIDVSYLGFHVHNESHDLCEDLSCPVSAGDFVLSHSLKLPGITPPGSYTLTLTVEDKNDKQLGCIRFGFTIGFWGPEKLSSGI